MDIQMTKPEGGLKVTVACQYKECKDVATKWLSQDNKYYCEKHSVEEVENFIKTVAGLGSIF